MRVGVIGINHKLADLKLREQLAKASQKLFNSELTFVQGTQPCILLSTCNRTEIYFTSNDLTETHSYLLAILRAEINEVFEHKLYSYFGVDCFNHLARVTAGLDSAILGETEIQGQVKQAYENACLRKEHPKEIHYLFQKSMNIGKKIRSEFSLGQCSPTLEQAIYQTGKDFFGDLESVKILFVGASEINCKILNYFKYKNIQSISLCNRSKEAVQQLVDTKQISELEWSKLPDWHTFDWVIFGTKSPHYLINQSTLNKDFKEQKLLIDLSVPRNVDPKLCRDKRLTIWNIDQINRLLQINNRSLHKLFEQAEKKINEMTENHFERYLLKEQSRLALLTDGFKIQHFQDNEGTGSHPGYYPFLSQIG